MFAAAVVVGLVVVAAGIWLLTRGDDTPQGTAIVQAVPADATTAPAGDPTSSTGPAAPSSAGTAAANPTSSASSAATAAAPVGTVDPTALAAVLIGEDDVSGAITLNDSAATSGQDPDHPLTDYRYCGRDLDLAQVGPGAKRVMNTNILSPDSLVASTVTVTASDDAAQALIDRMVANAKACTTYTDSSAEIRILSVAATADGARITEQITSFGSSVDLTIVTTRVGDIITTLEITPVTEGPDRLEQLLTSRAAALPR